jgi:hypothetical protein
MHALSRQDTVRLKLRSKLGQKTRCSTLPIWRWRFPHPRRLGHRQFGGETLGQFTTELALPENQSSICRCPCDPTSTNGSEGNLENGLPLLRVIWDRNRGCSICISLPSWLSPASDGSAAWLLCVSGLSHGRAAPWSIGTSLRLGTTSVRAVPSASLFSAPGTSPAVLRHPSLSAACSLQVAPNQGISV